MLDLKEGDWICAKCERFPLQPFGWFVNFRSKDSCFKCHAPKKDAALPHGVVLVCRFTGAVLQSAQIKGDPLSYPVQPHSAKHISELPEGFHNHSACFVHDDHDERWFIHDRRDGVAVQSPVQYGNNKVLTAEICALRQQYVLDHVPTDR